jgi:inorganic pyrophosphatase
MTDLTRLPNHFDPKTGICSAIIETPRGRRNKFDYDPDSNLFKLGGLLPEGMTFPFDFGFIPSTLGDDGDPLDVMVLMKRSKLTAKRPSRTTAFWESRFIPTIMRTSNPSTM